MALMTWFSSRSSILEADKQCLQWQCSQQSGAHCLSLHLFPSEVNFHLRIPRWEEKPSSSATIVDPGAFGKKKRLIFYPEHLGQLLLLSLQFSVHIIYRVLCGTKISFSMIKNKSEQTICSCSPEADKLPLTLMAFSTPLSANTL